MSALEHKIWIAMAVLAWLLAACGGEPACGPGSALQDGVCVLAKPVSCGPGTRLVGGKCALDSDASAASDGCVAQCVSAAKPCGSDGCGGSCGACGQGEVCLSGVCEAAFGSCAPLCQSKSCGDDGCGGSCGSCQGGQVCSKEGACVDACIPDCIGKGCGADGCGGSCGSCAAGELCSPVQLCVASTWSCDPFRYGHDGLCDCGCGAADPDCAKPTAPLLGCPPFHTCAAGVCKSSVPTGWSCPLAAWNDGIACDCGCGAADPDCAKPGTGSGGCKNGEVCDSDGKCGPCKPNCSGKACGSDGCGGVCGACPGPSAATPNQPPLACIGGQCVDGCLPTPLQCLSAQCGDDGCGGSCGSCKTGEFCAQGQCLTAPGHSCQGYCKGKAPAGCSCEFGCEKQGNCCPDYQGTCVCKPNCAGKVCGPDGCGGFCGSCKDAPGKPFCDGTGQCQATCKPVCSGKACGPDGCGGNCGSCAAGGTCNSDGLCVPAEWSCLPQYYADGSLCDCSCGAADPDCSSIAATAGCPAFASCEPATGVCKVPFCNHKGECKAPDWCVGHYPVGQGLQKGICGLPNPMALGAGAPCSSDATCATGLCLAGACREPCQSDQHCAKAETCIAITPPQGLAGKPKGAVAACYGSVVLGATCKSKADCKGSGELCLAFAHPTTLAPLYRCGKLVSDDDELQGCAETAECAPGLLCAGGQCRRPCPGGAGDCPAKHSCAPAVLATGVLTAASDDVLVNACTPNSK